MAQPAGTSDSARTSLLSIAIYLFRSPVHAPVLTGLQQGNPTLGVLETLLFSIGLPFFIISASNPLLQSWFSRRQHHRAVDPYFLFAASNAGSLIALVAFPLVLEPSLGLNEQYKLWRVGFGVLVTLMCAIALALKPLATVSIDGTHYKEVRSSATEDAPNNGFSVWCRLRWLALSFFPSSLILGVTTYITADVARIGHQSRILQNTIYGLRSAAC